MGVNLSGVPPTNAITGGGSTAAYGAAGGLTFTGTQPASVGTATGTAAPDWTWTGATGGTTSIITTGTGGTGTDFTVTTAAGGVASAAATASTGGRGGNVAFSLGMGGHANNAANLGTNLGGKGGSFTVDCGTGGTAANGTDTGGAGGDLTLQAGAGGDGDTAGVGGNVSITAGNAGTGGNVNGGSITLTAGRDTGSGTEGPITLVTGGSTRVTVAGTGAVTIATPTSGTALTISGGGASITGLAEFFRTGTGLQSVVGLYNLQAAAAGVGPQLVFGGDTGAAVMAQVVTAWNGAANTDAYLSLLTRRAGTLTEVIRFASTGAVTINAPASGTGLTVSGGGTNSTGANVLQTAATAGGATTLTITPGAHTAMTSTAVADITLAAHTVTFTDGQTLALARSVVFGATTFAGATGGGTETVTTAITAEFGLPVQGTNLTMTNAPVAARFLGNVILGNILPPAAGPTNTLAIADGTAPASVVANSSVLYSSGGTLYVNGSAGGLALAAGTLKGVGLAMPHVVNKAASANVRNSHDAEASTVATGYTKLKTITITNGLLGAQRFLFDLKTAGGGATASGRIYRNGVALGTEQTDVTAGYVTKSEDLTQEWNPGDTAELYAKTSDGAQAAYVQNFRIAYDDSATVTVASANS